MIVAKQIKTTLDGQLKIGDRVRVCEKSLASFGETGWIVSITKTKTEEHIEIRYDYDRNTWLGGNTSRFLRKFLTKACCECCGVQR